MKCNIQDILEIDLPDNLANTVDLYNNEWDLETGQAWEMKNFIKLTLFIQSDNNSHFHIFSTIFRHVNFLWNYFWNTLAFNCASNKRNCCSDIWNQIFKYTFWHCIFKSSSRFIFGGFPGRLLLRSIWLV